MTEAHAICPRCKSRVVVRLRRSDVCPQCASTEASADPRARSFALGYLGRLYEEDGRHKEALALTERALFAAQAAGARDSLFRWQWQAGRIHRAQGDRVHALAAHRQA